MAPGNKKAPRGNNKKKKGKLGHGGGGSSSKSEPNGASGAAPNKKKKLPTKFSQSVLDNANWSDYINQHDEDGTAAPRNPRDFQSIYFRYKEATKRVKERLRSMVPEEIFREEHVRCLVDAVDYLEANSIANIPVSLMNDLKLAIRVRQRVATSKYQGGDAGHSYFLSALLYCFAVLRQLTPLTKRAHRSEQQDEEKTERDENRFAALSVEDEDEDEEEDLPSGTVPKPVVPQEPSQLTLKQVMAGSDREAAILFLMTLDDIMRHNVLMYSTLKKAWARYKSEDYPPSVVIEDLLEASTAANMGIQYVQYLEQTLVLEYPHMNTIYRLLSVLVFPELTSMLTNEITRLSPLGSEFTEIDAKMFLGDCLERAVRNDSDPVMKNLGTEFCGKWQVPPETVERVYIKGINDLVAFELPVGSMRAQNRSIIEEIRQKGLPVEEGSWLSQFEFIGTADRTILMTTKHLQSLSNVIRERHCHLILKEGFFGKRWDETKKGMAKRIMKDMDELMMGEILPVLINLCDGPLLQKLPLEDELLPMFTLLRDYVKDPKMPVSWALAFSIHTLATSIFEVQGGNDVHDIADVAESCFDLYFDQLTTAAKRYEGRAQPKHWAENVRRIQVLQCLVAPPTLQPSREQTIRAFWNPLCAGNLMGYIIYFSNLQEGSWMVDNFSQLRMTLHLYNALKEVGLPPIDNHGTLEALDRNFQNSKAIWEGPKPTRGTFVLQWWIAFGTEVKEARRMSNEAAARFSKAHGASNKAPSRSRLQDTARRMTPIEPDKLSKSFRRIVNRDFTDVVDTYHKDVERQKANPLYDHIVRCNDTLDAIEVDQPYLAMNMTALGAHLNYFIDRFFDHCWKKEVQAMVRATPDSMRYGRRTDGRSIGRQSWESSDSNLERLAMVHIFAQEILGRLDFVDLPTVDPVIIQPAAAMSLFFEKLPPISILFFAPIIAEDEE
ncbi:hypothetical protein MHU86_2386 [Fragilaria crotonensis]|nr:hypothetical protein MHU86_2386 [Fragilaria crotonensis]